MIRQHAEFALHSGRSNLVYLLIQKESAGGHHFKSNFVCHDPWRIESKDNYSNEQSSRASTLVTGQLLRCQFLRLFHCFFYGTDHVERLFRDIIVFAVDDFLKPANGVFQLDVLTGRTCKCFSDVEGLG
jgi:hypothetical protein